METNFEDLYEKRIQDALDREEYLVFQEETGFTKGQYVVTYWRDLPVIGKVTGRASLSSGRVRVTWHKNSPWDMAVFTEAHGYRDTDPGINLFPSIFELIQGILYPFDDLREIKTE